LIAGNAEGNIITQVCANNNVSKNDRYRLWLRGNWGFEFNAGQFQSAWRDEIYRFANFALYIRNKLNIRQHNDKSYEVAPCVL